MAKKILFADKARKLCRENLSPRYERLDKLEAYVECRQYIGRTPWKDGSEKPLLERAPAINYPVVQQAIESNNDFVLGEGRWPEFTTFSSEDDRALDPDFGLNEDDSKVLDSVIDKAIKQSRLTAIAQEVLSAGQSCGTVVAIFGIRRGKLTCETIRAKWCTPTFLDESTTELASLEIRYPYVDSYLDKEAGGWAERCLIYRRILTTTDDTVFVPASAADDGTEPKWAVDKSRTVKHNLGFCPARWYPFLKTVSAANEIDGVAIHEGRFDLIDSLNFDLSQKDRAAFYSGDPQLVETGVSPEEEPGEPGRTATSVTGPSGFAARVVRPSGAARRRGAASIWRYTSHEARVEYLTLGADGLKALEDNCRDIRAKVQEALKVVFIDPEHVKHAAEFSNKAIRTMMKSQLARCDKIREDFGDNFLIPAVCTLLRIAYVVHKRRPGSVYLPGIVKAIPIMDRFDRQVEAANTEGDAAAKASAWFDPHIDLVWGPYFEPDPQEESFIIQGIVQAYAAKIIDRKTAVQRLPDSFAIDNADQYVEGLDEADQQAHEQQMDLMHAMNSTAKTDGEGAGQLDGGGSGEDAVGGKAPKASPRARAGNGSAVASS